MAWTDRNELDEEYPWMSIIRYLVEKIQKEHGENK